VTSYKSTGNKLLECEGFKMSLGEGVEALVDGNLVLAGNEKLILSHNIVLYDSVKKEAEKYLSEGCTVIYAAIGGEIAGYIVLTDTMREESANMISRLRSLKVEPVLLTGDNVNTANTIGRKLGIEDIYANCLPEDKLNIIGEYQNLGADVCMIGDGVNDAPALKKSNVGIAMGGIGSDIAVDAADIVLVDDEVKELPHLFALSKRMMTTIKLNLTFSMTLNFVAIALAITGILNPVVGALVHNAGSVLVIGNSALLLKWRPY
jgi:P-type E1-E2 ATPase